MFCTFTFTFSSEEMLMIAVTLVTLAKQFFVPYLTMQRAGLQKHVQLPNPRVVQFVNLPGLCDAFETKMFHKCHILIIQKHSIVD